MRLTFWLVVNTAHVNHLDVVASFSIFLRHVLIAVMPTDGGCVADFVQGEKQIEKGGDACYDLHPQTGSELEHTHTHTTQHAVSLHMKLLFSVFTSATARLHPLFMLR